MHRSLTKMADTFMYFGYGSNLLRERILIRNPTAIFKTIGRLDDYHVGFGHHMPDGNWKGATATISECSGDHVWGCVWELGIQDQPNLDRQEGVEQGVYRPFTVTVHTPGGDQIDCRSYQLVDPRCDDPRPSPQYLSVIRRGAKQNDLPQAYQDRLASIEHNGYTGHLQIMDDLERLLEEFKLKENK